MKWLPALPSHDAFAELRAHTNPTTRLAAIVRLAHFDLDFLQTAKLDRLLEKTVRELDGPAPLPNLTRVRLAWLASSTVEQLLPGARIAGLRRGLYLDIHLAPYGQYQQALLADEGALVDFQPEAVFIQLAPEDALPELPLAATAAEAATAVAERVAELTQLWSRARERHRALVIHATVPNLAERLFGSYELQIPGARSSLIARLNRALVDAAPAAGAIVCDLDGWFARLGHDAFDPVRWFQAKQLVAPALGPLFGEELARLVAAARGRSRKALVLDLDNTLWGGVVGDDGVDGLILGQGDAAGEAFVAFQRYVKQLATRGIVLAVCSKNNADTALAPFALHREMVLSRDDIAVFVANWTDKATNLRTIAATLNLGLDALVFVDDNPVERDQVRRELPEVAVPEMPEDPAYFVRTLAAAGYFETVAFSAEDWQRSEQYQTNAKRQRLQEGSSDMDGFLQSLGMTMVTSPVGGNNLTRVVQLINKTNQFNLTTRRYTEAEVEAVAGSPDHIARCFRLRDRFGDNGIISVVIAAREHDAWNIETWLMSCRVLGRKVEQAVLAELARAVQSHGGRALVGRYLPTAKNGLVANHYRDLGFQKADATDQRWTLDLDTFVPALLPIELIHD